MRGSIFWKDPSKQRMIMLESDLSIVTTSWDDGHPSDMKLAEVLMEFGIKGTFYIAPRNREREVMATSDLQALSKYFEIGAHSLTHTDLRRLNDRNLQKEVGGSKTELENLIGAPVHMFCYPKGRYNRRVRSAVVNAGFMGARTTKESYLNIWTDSYQMPTTIHAFLLPTWIRLRHEIITWNWHGLREFSAMGLRKSWVQLAYDFFNRVLIKGGVWHLWGHSWEIEEHHLWDDLRMVLESVAHREGVSYLTNGQVIQQFKTHRAVR